MVLQLRAMRHYLGAVLTFSWVVRSDGHCRGLDRRALINLYEALDGANWTNNKNWNVTSGTPAENKANDPCSIEKRWFGVGFTDPCEKYLDDIVGWGPETDYLAQVRGAGQGCFAGRITALNLHRNGLRGNLSNHPTLGDLTNLTYFDISWNQVEGAIPTQIGLINNIQTINLHHNLLSGTLPSELGTLNSLGPSFSEGCNVDDPCPEGEQMKMNDLNVGHNLISGSIPSEIGELVHLRILDMSNNELSGAVPSQLGKLSVLQLFYLRENHLNGSLPTELFPNMTALRYIMFQENEITGALPSEIGRLHELNELHMQANRLDAPLPSEIGELPVLTTIQLQDNRINGSIPATIGKLRALRHLDLYNNSMSGDIPSSIKELINLDQLYVQNDHLTPVRQRFCRMRIANVGKYNWRIVRDEYALFTSMSCPDMHDVDFTFNSLQASASYDATS